MTEHPRRIILGCVLALALGVPAAACGGDDGAGSGLEKADITVGTIPVADTAPLQLAVQRGLFKAEGLKVKLQIIAGGAEAVPKLKSGALAVSFGNYVSFLSAGVKGALNTRIVAEGFQSGGNTHAILVPEDSPIRGPKDLAGKKIGVNTKRNVSTLLVRASLKPIGIDLDEDKNFQEMPFPNMEAALKSKSVDAVQAVEPFVTQLQSSIGARVVSDLSTGVTADFPIAGYAVTAEFAKKNPKTVAAFQRALLRAQAMAGDRKVVQQILPTYTKITSGVAARMNYGTYPTSLDAGRIQRVADLMLRFGYLPKPLDVKPLVVPAPK